MRNKLSLVMIVKNEENVITKCLASVCGIVDYWVIVDTGSTDDTKHTIRTFMESRGIPGEMHDREWVNFSHNRNESLSLARDKAEYLLVMDADDYLEIKNTEEFKDLSQDAYKINVLLDGMEYRRIQILKSGYDWSYEGVLHEYIKIPDIPEYREGTIKDSYIVASASYPNGHPKYLDDAKILIKEIDDPSLAEDLRNRYTFYCGLSLMWGGDFTKAIELFEKRSLMGGWPEEIYVSLWYLAKLKKATGESEDVIINSYLKAWEYRPGRREAVYELLKYLYSKNRCHLGFVISRSCISSQVVNDSLFVDKDIRDWGIYSIYAQYSYKCGFVAEAISCTEKLINSAVFLTIPEGERNKIMNNLEVYEISLIESYSRINN